MRWLMKLFLQSERQNAYWGQPQRIDIKVVDDYGKPQESIQVLLLAMNGILRSSFGFRVKAGSTINLVTDLKGEAQVNFIPAVSARLTPVQQAAFLGALNQLEIASRKLVENSTQDPMLSIVESYCKEFNHPLRVAVDNYFDADAGALLNFVNPETPNYQEAHIFGYILPAENFNSMHGMHPTATTILRLYYKNWLPSFIATYLQLQKVEYAGLEDEIKQLIETEVDDDYLTDRITNRLKNYTKKNHGQIGELVNQNNILKAVRNYLDKHFNSLPSAKKSLLFPTLKGVLTGININNVDLRSEINTRINENIKKMDGKFLNVQTELDIARTNYQEFLKDYQLFGSQFKQFTEANNAIKTLEQQFGNRYAEFNQKYEAFNKANTTFTGQLANFNNNMVTFNQLYDQVVAARTDITTKYGDFKTRFDQFTENNNNFITANKQFGDKYTDFNQKYGDLSSKYSDFTIKFNQFVPANNTFIANYNQFNSQYTKFSENYTNFAKALESFKPLYEEAILASKNTTSLYAEFSKEYDTYKTNYTILKDKVQKIESNLATIFTRLKRLEDQVASIKR